MAEALPLLKKAAVLQVLNVRYSYVYAVALESAGRLQDAILVLEQALQQHPDNGELINALVHYLQKAGQLERANHYKQLLDKLAAQ